MGAGIPAYKGCCAAAIELLRLAGTCEQIHDWRCMPAFAASRSYPLPVELARDGIQRTGAGSAKRIDHRQKVARKLIGRSHLDVAPEPSGFGHVAGIARSPAISLACQRPRF